MHIKNIGVVSPGDMGQAVAARLKECGCDVFTALDGRSARTKTLAREAGLTDCGSLDTLVATCDMILSILDPGAALAKAHEVAAAIRQTGRKTVYRRLQRRLAADRAGDRRHHPRRRRHTSSMPASSARRRAARRATRIYVSGPDAGAVGAVQPTPICCARASARASATLPASRCATPRSPRAPSRWKWNC